MTACLAVLALVANLHAGNPKPDWLSGQSAQYPKSSYIIGVGQAATQEKAADRARAEIAKSFSLSLSADSRSTLSETDANGGSSASQTITDDVRTSTRKVLDGVELIAYWDDGKGSTYALAVLNREHSLKIIKDKLEEIDKAVPDLQGQIDKADGKFARLKLALKLLRVTKSRRRLNADFRVLNPEGKGIPAPAELDKALAQARAAINAVQVQVEVSGVEAAATATRLVDGLAAYGLKAVEKSSGTADVIVTAKSAAQRLEPENLTWYWARGSVLVKLSYGATGEVFSRFEEKGQEASRDPATSVDVVLTKLADQAADRAFKVLTSNDLLDE